MFEYKVICKANDGTEPGAFAGISVGDEGSFEFEGFDLEGNEVHAVVSEYDVSRQLDLSAGVISYTEEVEYQVIEDNGGGMYLFFFDNAGDVILGLENIEFATPGDLEGITPAKAKGWDSKLEDPQAHYDNITSYQFGWQIVADTDGVYPEHMGRAAQILFRVEGD